MNLAWERVADGIHRCRLPFLDVTVGLVCGRTGTLLIDTGTTLLEANAVKADVAEDSDQKAWPATLGRVLVAGGPDAAYVPGHGAVVDAEFVQRQGWMLRST
jgi:glyoxylase-like metal-dependent hydrolase (beta-lactamase superfamily II)